jgi:hypothetical protein
LDCRIEARSHEGESSVISSRREGIDRSDEVSTDSRLKVLGVIVLRELSGCSVGTEKAAISASSIFSPAAIVKPRLKEASGSLQVKAGGLVIQVISPPRWACSSLVVYRQGRGLSGQDGDKPSGQDGWINGTGGSLQSVSGRQKHHKTQSAERPRALLAPARRDTARAARSEKQRTCAVGGELAAT